MVGGKVVGVVRRADNTLLNVQGTGCESGSSCAVRCIEKRIDNGKPVSIGIGDSVWWQSGIVFWKPKDSAHSEQGIDWDIQLPKVGYSH